MSQTDLIIHDEKDNVAVVVVDKTSKNQECVGWIMENDKTIKIKSMPMISIKKLLYIDLSDLLGLNRHQFWTILTKTHLCK